MQPKCNITQTSPIHVLYIAYRCCSIYVNKYFYFERVNSGISQKKLQHNRCFVDCRGGGIGLGRCLSRSVFHVTAPSLRFIQLSKRLPNRLKISLPVRIPLSPFSLPFCASVFHFLYSARFPSVPLLLFTFLSLCLPLFTSLSVSFSPVFY